MSTPHTVVPLNLSAAFSLALFGPAIKAVEEGGEVVPPDEGATVVVTAISHSVPV